MQRLSERLSSSLDGRYTIDSLLGQGGMSFVFLAQDTKHHRKVALKVMRPDLTAGLGTERFLNEIRVTAQLQHPHILPLFDSGEADSLLFFVMPFVDGETLEEKLKREGPLDVGEAVAIAKSVAAALHYAHQQGVVHRDIKPANVMLTAGLPLVADFGIAGALEVAGAMDGLTGPGMSIGTPGYQSPEQAAGDPVDSRGDVYALGCLMYEMLTGEPPYVARSSRALLAKVLVDPVPSPRRLRSDLPQHLDELVRRALAKEPDERYASALEMANAMSVGGRAPVHVRESLPIARSERTEFVARDEERTALMSALDEAIEGHGSLVLLAGEPGVGKTRLAEEILLEAQRRDVLCFIGSSYEGEGGVPYGPFVETLEYAARALPEDVFRTALGDAAPEVARIMPKLRTLFPEIPPAIELPTEQQRRYLFNSYREFVERGTQISPLVVLLDDLHWADESSILLLEHLAQHIPTQRILIIGTFRHLEVSPALARSLANLTRQRLANRINVSPLGRDAVGELVAALGGGSPPEALSAAIHRETEGNPFFVEEVFRDLAERGELFDAEGRWLKNVTPELARVPEGVRVVVGRRLDRVGEDVLTVLTAAAVIGRLFPHDMMEALEIVSEDALFDALETAEAAHLISSAPVGRDTVYRFSHELIRSTLAERLSVPRRRRLHHRIAEAMKRIHGSALEAHAADYSHHLYEAGSRVEAGEVVRFLVIAAGQALDAAAFEEALQHLDRALELEADLPARLRADLLSRRGEALRGMGEWPEAMESWSRALPILEELGDQEEVAAHCQTMGDIAAWMGRFDQTRPLIVRGLEAVGEEPSAARARLLTSLAGIDVRVGADLDAGLQLFHDAIEMGEALDQPRIVGYAQSMATAGYCDQGLLHGSIDMGRSAIETLQSAGSEGIDTWHLVDALARVVFCTMTTGDSAEAARYSAQLRPLARRVGHHGALFLDEMAMGHLKHVFTGEIDRQIEWARARFGAWPNLAGYAHFYTLYESIGLFWRGDWEQALEAIGLAAEGFPEDWWKGRVYAWEFHLHAYLKTGKAMEYFESHRWRIPRPGQAAGGGQKLFGLVAVEGLAVTGALDEAAALYPFTRSAIDDGWLVWESGLGERYSGIAAASGGNWSTAEEHFETALRQARENPFRTEGPETRRWYAWMLLRRGERGDRDRARDLLDEAVRQYRRLGMNRHVTLAESLLK